VPLQKKGLGEGTVFTRREFLERAGMAAGARLAGNGNLLAFAGPGKMWDEPASPELLERARTLLEKAPLIDTHNDLPEMLVGKGADMARFDLSKVQKQLCADLPRMREGRIGAQYWSVYVDSATQKTRTSLHEAVRTFDVALRVIRSQPDFAQARTTGDIEQIHKSGKIACLLGVEGGYMIENSAAALRVFYELGARYMTLTHWDNIDWADSATDRDEHYGLTEFGKQVVREMNRIGMFVDLSHVSADTMRDALSVSKAPAIFSHSNSYAIDPHPRNAPDDVLRMLKTNGGVIHVNFIRDFVAPKNADWSAKREAAIRELHLKFTTDAEVEKGIKEWEKQNPYPRPGIKDVADHIDHIREVAGIEHIGIGADFYSASGESMVDGLGDVTRYPYLFAELLRRNYSDEDVLKIAGRNHLRAMRQMESVATELQKTEPAFLGEGVAKPA